MLREVQTRIVPSRTAAQAQQNQHMQVMKALIERYVPLVDQECTIELMKTINETYCIPTYEVTIEGDVSASPMASQSQSQSQPLSSTQSSQQQQHSSQPQKSPDVEQPTKRRGRPKAAAGGQAQATDTPAQVVDATPKNYKRAFQLLEVHLPFALEFDLEFIRLFLNFNLYSILAKGFTLLGDFKHWKKWSLHILEVCALDTLGIYLS